MKEITVEELKKMRSDEGIIFQGCGGDLNEWFEGINQMLTESGILKNGYQLEDVYSFKNDEVTNLLFKFDKDISGKIDMGRLAMWRIQTHECFCGTWLSDYLENKFAINEDDFSEEIESGYDEKSDCELIGQDGNIFNLMGIAARTLRRNGLDDSAKEMVERITNGAGSYHETLGIIGEYVNITGPKEEQDMDM